MDGAKLRASLKHGNCWLCGEPTGRHKTLVFGGRSVMKWAGMYLLGFIIVVGGLLAALWKLGVLERIGTAWTLIGLAILVGIGIMISVANSGRKDNIEIDNK